MKNRREVLVGMAAVAVTSCTKRREGPEAGPSDCSATDTNIEGPFYRPGAPERSDLDQYGDAGTPLSLVGQVFEKSCAQPLPGAVIEFWHANPEGGYDNSSPEMRYRCRVTTDDEGRFSLNTLLPGRYLNGEVLRPRHIHVKVFTPDGTERLTTQLYMVGDPYIAGDPFVMPSLVLPFTGSETTTMAVKDVLFVLT